MADTLTNPMHVEVISPDGPIYQETGVEMVVARAADGEFAVMKNHLCASLKAERNKRWPYLAVSWK